MEQQEDLDWIFVCKIPMLIEKKNIDKQQKIETWLDLYQLTREVDEAIAGFKAEEAKQPIKYVC